MLGGVYTDGYSVNSLTQMPAGCKLTQPIVNITLPGIPFDYLPGSDANEVHL